MEEITLQQSRINTYRLKIIKQKALERYISNLLNLHFINFSSFDKPYILYKTSINILDMLTNTYTLNQRIQDINWFENNVVHTDSEGDLKLLKERKRIIKFITNKFEKRLKHLNTLDQKTRFEPVLVILLDKYEEHLDVSLYGQLFSFYNKVITESEKFFDFRRADIYDFEKNALEQFTSDIIHDRELFAKLPITKQIANDFKEALKYYEINSDVFSDQDIVLALSERFVFEIKLKRRLEEEEEEVNKLIRFGI